ncbi:type I polyketide synthase [Ktedonobacter robiniae]|uniref:Carrier domain-containing protein n=1 Tax=Ktedonobacter robiniae TaxID=2778365 RepID=A0ABQ3UQ97_9CHLR|nr:type I polyketide synthase [Ktedonobacter robiniae]GHO54873.1 hypothetical protein KSB_33480 [Ktedonobacter robiniae]
MDSHHSTEPIAIVGLGCRFPGDANSPQAFWELLLNGTDPVGEIPTERWDLRRYYHPDPSQPGKMYSRHASLLKQVDQFDAAFFGISPMEASRMDPQQRLLLEVAWEGLEDAGLVPQQLAGSQTGVFVGICSRDYSDIQRQDPTAANPYSSAGSDALSIAANRISYLFDFHGPSFSVDTACSSSLVAVHLACESLRHGECELALAAGVNILLDPNMSINFSKAGILSPNGRCRTFDAAADGYVRGEGAGVVVLKPLSQALADGNSIYAVIRATAINQDGRTPNLHYPSQQAQTALLRQVYSQAEISPHQVHYIEAHGTGTSSGDFVECSALGEVFAAYRSQEQPLRIGSVKTNIGHLEGASGIAGLIKAALALKHRQIPANLHFQNPNPRIAFEQLRLKVQTTTEALPPFDDPYIVGINSFGFGGTNAHVILQEYSASAPAELTSAPFGEDQSFLLPLSARSPRALGALAQAVLDFLDKPGVPSLRDLCFSASLHREHHPYRLALTVTSLDDLKEKLQVFLASAHRPGITLQGVALNHTLKDNAKRLAFVFSGNGPQWFAMGRHLLTHDELFRSVIERCDQRWLPLAGWSLIEELLADEACSRMDRTEVAQPTLFALQIALSKVWKSLGIEPQAVIGHSVGEIAAAYVAGILSLEDAIQVLYHRSRLQELTAGQGAMVAVGISAEKAHELIAPYGSRVSLASVSSPQSVTLSGEKAALEEITASLVEQGIFCRFLKLNYAFHHGTLDPLREEFLRSSQGLQPREGHIPFISTVVGTSMRGDNCDADYWWQNLRCPVQFAPGVQHLLDDGFTTFVEIGPHPVLSGYIAECLVDKQAIILPSLRRKENDQQLLLRSLASLYTLGFPVAWEHLVAGGKYIKLPTYPWQHERFWNEPQASSQGMQGHTVHPLLGYRLAAALPLWENHFGNHDLRYLHDHQVDGVALFPAAGYPELFLAAAGDHFQDRAYELAQIQIQRPLFLSDDQQLTLQTILLPEDGKIELRGHVSGGWLTYASAQLTPLSLSAPTAVDVDALRVRCQHELTAVDFYQECRRRGYHYGPAFQLVEHISLGEQEALGMVRLPEDAQDYLLHPAVLDCCIQVLLALSIQHDAQLLLPVGIERFRCYAKELPSTPLYSYARLISQGAHSLTANYVLLDSQGHVLVEITGVRLQAANFSDQNASLSTDEHIYEEAWVPTPLPSLKHGVGSLPSVTALAAQTYPGIEQVCREFPTERYYQHTQPFTDQLCLAYMLTTLRQLGWDMQVGEHITVSQLLSRLHILPRYERLLHAWCLVLAEEHILTPSQEEDGWTVVHTPEDMNLQELLRTGLTDHSENHLGLLLVMRCGHQLAEILTGAIDPLSVLFPDGDATLLEHLYTNELLLRRSNSIAQEMLHQFVSQLPEGQTLRILEVGAGTGGTTSYLLPILPADRSTYIFTDLSEAFLQRAQQKYQNYPFVSYQILDLEHDPLTQGFEEHSFDLVIASNVIHATSDIQQSLHAIHQLLAPEGMFCLIESTRPLWYRDILTLGLLEGFWLFQDTDLRPCLPF